MGPECRQWLAGDKCMYELPRTEREFRASRDVLDVLERQHASQAMQADVVIHSSPNVGLMSDRPSHKCLRSYDVMSRQVQASERHVTHRGTYAAGAGRYLMDVLGRVKLRSSSSSIVGPCPAYNRNWASILANHLHCLSNPSGRARMCTINTNAGRLCGHDGLQAQCWEISIGIQA